MGRILLGVLIFILISLTINYIVFFWLKTRRKWNEEDRLSLKQSKREALEEFQESQLTYEEFMARDYTPQPTRLRSVGRRPVTR